MNEPKKLSRGMREAMPAGEKFDVFDLFRDDTGLPSDDGEFVRPPVPGEG
jgi:hypothetical protein